MISTLAPGRVRYALMLREDGFVFDDGTVARLSPTHFVLTTTTANAGSVFRHMDFCHRIIKPELDVCIEGVTDQWAQFALAGPQARNILAKLAGESVDVSDTGLPFMATIEAELCGRHLARLFRISFSGELAYEIAVPASHGAALAAALQEAGATPYGLEALNVMRLEKGHPTAAPCRVARPCWRLTVPRWLACAQPCRVRSYSPARILFPRAPRPMLPTTTGILRLPPIRRRWAIGLRSPFFRRAPRA
jgi:glycine cleavage system aminomethyltransferase T